MMDLKIKEEPKLEKPGKGLPFLEWFMAKYILLPGAYKSTSNHDARRFFEIESNKICRLFEKTDRANLTKRVLIQRLRGLEDSSRYWSASMAVEHLVIVGKGITGTVVDLTGGGTTRKPVKIEDVKPNQQLETEEVLKAFEEMTRDFLSLPIEKLDDYPKAKYPHPWFGPMNARQWYILAGRHQAIHRLQIEKILEGLN